MWLSKILNFLGEFLLGEGLKESINRVKGIPNVFNSKKRKKFYSVINSQEYKEFELEVLKEYYGLDFFTLVNNRYYPAFSVKYKSEDKVAVNSIRDFDILTLNQSELGVDFNEKEHQKYKKTSYYKKYHPIVGEKIKAPNRPGFLLKEINLNGDYMSSFSAKIGTYGENVYSAHYLEYEMYDAFLYAKRCKLTVKNNYAEIKKRLELRNHIHSNVDINNYFESMRKSLLSGNNYETLLSVQMIVLMKEGETYNIKIIQRSDNVAISPGKYQIVPAGGFEILNDSSNGYSKNEIKDNSSAGCAVFREYLEEIFGKGEFEGLGAGSVNEVLMKDEEIILINNLIKEKKAHFGFLGCIVDLILLRHELSFYLVIDDEDYSLRHKFLGNEEIKNHSFISNINVDNFEEDDEIWEDLLGPGAAIWKLFKETDIYLKIKK